MKNFRFMLADSFESKKFVLENFDSTFAYNYKFS